MLCCNSQYEVYYHYVKKEIKKWTKNIHMCITKLFRMQHIISVLYGLFVFIGTSYIIIRCAKISYLNIFFYVKVIQTFFCGAQYMPPVALFNVDFIISFYHTQKCWYCSPKTCKQNVEYFFLIMQSVEEENICSIYSK